MNPEQFTIEQSPHNQELIPIFEAIDRTVSRQEGTPNYNKILGKELRRRSVGHRLDPIEFGQQYWAWKKQHDSH